MHLNDISSLSDILFVTKDLYPNKIAVSDATHELTYQELYVKTVLFSKYLKDKHDVLPNDVIGFLIPNSIEFVIAHFAIQFLGAVSSPLDPDINHINLISCIKQANIGLIIIKKIVKFNNKSLDSEVLSKVISFDYITELLEKPISNSDINISSLFKSKLNVNGIASYLFTTGSTGVPKGVIIKQSNVIQSISNIVEFIDYSDDDSELITLPLSHSFGLGHLYCNLASAGTSYLLDGISNFKLLFDFLNKKKPTGFPGTPSGFKILTKMFPNKLADCKDFLKFIVINSERCPPTLVRTLTTLLPNTKILIYYGLTEASRSTFIKFDRDTEDYYLDSVGKASPNVEIEIVDEVFLNNEGYYEGKIAIKGKHLAEGYVGKNSLFNMHNNWFITDDVGYLDKDKYLFLTGRLSTFINKAGIKVDPKEIVDLIGSLDFIKDVAVIGIDDEISGQIICVCFVSNTSKEKAEKAIIKECSLSLEKLKIPDLYLSVDSIPRNKTGKLLQPELKEKIQYD